MREEGDRFSWYLSAWWGFVSSLGVAITFITLPFPLIKNEFAGLTPAGGIALVALAGVGLSMGMFGGTVVGLGQWMILRAQWPAFQRDRGWIVATFIGSTIALTLGATTALLFTFAVDFPPREAFDTPDGTSPMLIDLTARGALFGAVVGTILGLFQWAALLKRANNAYVWLLGSIVGWMAAGVIYHVLYIIAGGPMANPTRDVGMNWQTYYSARGSATTAGWLSSSLLAWVVFAIAGRFLKFGRTTVPSPTD